MLAQSVYCLTEFKNCSGVYPIIGGFMIPTDTMTRSREAVPCQELVLWKSKIRRKSKQDVFVMKLMNKMKKYSLKFFLDRKENRKWVFNLDFKKET